MNAPKVHKRPNILFIHVDQMHFRAISAYGNSYVNTPALDRMVSDGTSFMQMYSTMPQCCPARASWYTGRMSTETGVPVNACPLKPELPDLGQWLGKHGDYNCTYAGKWHVPNRNVSKSFQQIYSSGMGEHADGSIARAAIGYLQNYSSDKPFFLNVGFMNPHDCCYTAGASGGCGKFRFAKEIKGKLPPLPENFTNNPKVASRTPGWKDLDWQYYIYSYYRLTEMVDAEIGRLYETVANSRFADNTVIIFTSDHGDGLGFHGHLSKGYMEEEAWHVPAIVIFPGHIAKGKRDTQHLISGVDIPATICDYAEVPMLPKMTIGKSLRPILEGEFPKWRDYVIGESMLGRGQVGIRDRQFKTILYRDNTAKVFDLKNDPLEQQNLADTQEGKAIRGRHLGYMREYISTIELAPVPTWSQVSAKYKNIFKNYNSWYQQILKET